MIQKVFLDFAGVSVNKDFSQQATEFMSGVIEKVQNAFEGSNVVIVTEQPDSGDYTRIDVTNSIKDGETYLGEADYDTSFDPNDEGVVRLDNLLKVGEDSNLTSYQTSNLVASNICHETAHTLGVDHSDDPSNLMYPSAPSNDLNSPPSFTEGQMSQMDAHAALSNFSPDDPSAISPFPEEDYSEGRIDDGFNPLEDDFPVENDESDTIEPQDAQDDGSLFDLL